MAKYNVKFACGHEEEVDLVGKYADRERKIAWMETRLCRECYEREAHKADAEVRMEYREYKQHYADYKTKADSYDAKTKTIIVYIPTEPIAEEMPVEVPETEADEAAETTETTETTETKEPDIQLPNLEGTPEEVAEAKKAVKEVLAAAKQQPSKIADLLLRYYKVILTRVRPRSAAKLIFAMKLVSPENIVGTAKTIAELRGCAVHEALEEVLK